MRNTTKLMNVVLGLLICTLIAPILLYTTKSAVFGVSSPRRQFLEDLTASTLPSDVMQNVLPQGSSGFMKEHHGIIFMDRSAIADNTSSTKEVEYLMPRQKSSRALSEANEEDSHQTTGSVTSTNLAADTLIQMDSQIPNNSSQGVVERRASLITAINDETRPLETKVSRKEATVSDLRVRQLKDQLVRARLYLSLAATKNNAHLARELRLRMKEVQRVLGEATKDSDLPRSARDKYRAMEESLSKGRRIQDDCPAMVKKLRAMLLASEEQLRAHKKQALFLTQLTAKTLPKGLQCLPLRLTTEYHSLNSSQQQFPNQEKLENPRLYHYALFSDNVLAASVVVNSAVTNAKDQSRHVFHVVTDRLNFAAMRLWFLVNPPGDATIQVQSLEEFTWLNSSYSPVLKQLGSPSVIDYYFHARRASADNMKYRNPKYLSILNHLRFYLPQIFPKISKVLFLDDDVVIQRDLTALWSLDLKGKVNGAVETCGENFHRFDRYLNFSNPLISRNFDPHACGWAFGMNIFDLDQWRKQNITEIYHSWQRRNHDRSLWKLGTLPPGLITFWNRTHPLDGSWHALGLGYNPNLNPSDIERAAVVHYNGNLKPWLEIAIPHYRKYWTRYVDFSNKFLHECNIDL